MAIDDRRVVRKQVQYRAQFQLQGKQGPLAPDWVTRETFLIGGSNWCVKFDGNGLTAQQVLQEMDVH